MAIVYSRYGDHYIPCFLIISPCIINAVIIFLLHLSVHTSIVKYPKQNKWLDEWWTSCKHCLIPCLRLRHYCMMLLAFDAPSSNYSAKRLVLVACKTNKIVTRLLLWIKTILHTWSVSTSHQSTLFKQKMLSYCMVVLE